MALTIGSWDLNFPTIQKPPTHSLVNPPQSKSSFLSPSDLADPVQHAEPVPKAWAAPLRG